MFSSTTAHLAAAVVSTPVRAAPASSSLFHQLHPGQQALGVKGTRSLPPIHRARFLPLSTSTDCAEPATPFSAPSTSVDLIKFSSTYFEIATSASSTPSRLWDDEEVLYSSPSTHNCAPFSSPLPVEKHVRFDTPAMPFPPTSTPAVRLNFFLPAVEAPPPAATVHPVEKSVNLIDFDTSLPALAPASPTPSSASSSSSRSSSPSSLFDSALSFSSASSLSTPLSSASSVSASPCPLPAGIFQHSSSTTLRARSPPSPAPPLPGVLPLLLPCLRRRDTRRGR
ncbi:hypothetical protein JCM8547_001217 [Rhodosporidiobolus lusitaniae]